mmetsp:Transcript_9423/g.14904  ORF Transcript_9423/g.14904 Transcript_9423/m.14904 type:complete len:519 (-) Transcript_9423:30-1586(-)
MDSLPVHDVIVIGAGAGGLGAACRLLRAGLKCVVLEARDRIGGRAHTIDDFGYPVDLGGQWIHGSCEDNPLFLFAMKTGQIGHKSLDPNALGRRYVDPKSGQLLAYRRFKEAGKAFAGIYRAIDESKLTPKTDQTILEIIQEHWVQARSKLKNDNSKLVLDCLVNSIEEYDGPIGKLSTIAYKKPVGDWPGGNSNLRCGYGALLGKIVENHPKLTILTSQRVAAIQTPWRVFEKKNSTSLQKEEKKKQRGGVGAMPNIKSKTESFVTVTTVEGKRFRGRFVIVAVPLGVLKKGDIEFKPPFPYPLKNSINALQQVGFNKIVIEFESKFHPPLEAKHVPFEIIPLGEDQNKFRRFFYWGRFSGRNIWLGYSMSAYAKSMADKGENAVIQDAIDIFQKAFGRSNPKFPTVKSFQIADWYSDPLARGSWTYVPLGASYEDVRKLQIGMPERHCLFAGEHTAYSNLGSVAGAFVSGEKAADNAINLLGGRGGTSPVMDGSGSRHSGPQIFSSRRNGQSCTVQ